MNEEKSLNPVTSATCRICSSTEALYTCPRCNVSYCSLTCYRDVLHAGCSEAFYRDQVVSELSSRSGHGDAESRHRMEEILVKFHNDASANKESLDSDDEEEQEDDDDLSTRLAGVNLDDADTVWQRLSQAEQSHFEKMLATGTITELLPSFTPWWEKASRFVQEIDSSVDTSADSVADSSKEAGAVGHEAKLGLPSVLTDVPAFKSIYKKAVSPCLTHNVANVIAVYVYTVRCFNGEHQDWSTHAAYVAWSLCGTLNSNHNYDSLLDAITCASTNASQKEGANQEDLSLMKADTQHVVFSSLFLPAALSDMLSLFRAALRHRPPTAKGPFSQRFCDGADNQLSRDKLRLAAKKLEFMLSWIQNKDNQA